MMAGWRIVRRVRAGDAFSGEGARRFGGRWNSPGTAVVYVSDSLALAALETLVHLNPQLSLDYVSFRVEWPDDLLENLDVPPAGWSVSPAGPASQHVGDQWARENRSPALAVPSTLIPSQRNFLLNPRHPKFPRLRISESAPFSFDPRLLSP
jgi:RES domain-containing protein